MVLEHSDPWPKRIFHNVPLCYLRWLRQCGFKLTELQLAVVVIFILLLDPITFSHNFRETWWRKFFAMVMTSQAHRLHNLVWLWKFLFIFFLNKIFILIMWLQIILFGDNKIKCLVWLQWSLSSPTLALFILAHELRQHNYKKRTISDC